MTGTDLAKDLTLATWPTTRQEDSEQTGAHHGVPDTLTSATKAAWGTPNCMDEMGPRTPESLAKAKAGCANIKDQLGEAPSGCLALTEKFVVRLMTLSAWLMGYTGAYLALWETASSRKSRQK